MHFLVLALLFGISGGTEARFLREGQTTPDKNAQVQSATSSQQEAAVDEMKQKAAAILRAVELENSPQAKMCRSHVGQTVAMTNFDTVIARYAKLTPKGEFETSAQFEDRRRAVLAVAGKRPVIVGVSVDRDFLDYDADAQELTIGSFAFGRPGLTSSAGSQIAAWNHLNEVGLKADLMDWGNVAIEVDTIDVTTGSYGTGNAFGAATRVTKITRTSRR